MQLFPTEIESALVSTKDLGTAQKVISKIAEFSYRGAIACHDCETFYYYKQIVEALHRLQMA